MSVHFLSITGDETGFHVESPEEFSIGAAGKTPESVLTLLGEVFAKGVEKGVFSPDAVLTVRTPDGNDTEISLSAGPTTP